MFAPGQKVKFSGPFGSPEVVTFKGYEDDVALVQRRGEDFTRRVDPDYLSEDDGDAVGRAMGRNV